jgi:anti-sigma regulatory factor (Ser/Thr protein kinase)
MQESSWSAQDRPSPGSGAVVVGEWAPTTPMDVTRHRQHLADAVRGRPGTPAADEDALERLLLAFEELVSNGMRHGGAPVHAAVTAFDGCWLLEVSDADAGRPPTPAIGRDPASGGLGLHLVARICNAHGWQADGGRKTVWALVQHTPAPAAPPGDHATDRWPA